MNYKSGLLLSVIILSFDFICGMESDQKEEQVQKKIKLETSVLNINENKKLDKFEYFNQLPKDIQREIIKYLNFRDVKKFRLVNKELRALIADKDFNERKKLANMLGLELMDAVRKKNVARIKEIIDFGNANLDLQYNKNCTALIEACYLRYTEIVKLLIDGKANLDLKDNNGNTALHFVCYNFGHPEIVQLLIDAKANLDLENNYGYIALDLAQNYHIKILIQRVIDKSTGYCNII